MSLIETRYDLRCHRYDITGHINEKDLTFSPAEAILAVKRELVSSIVEHIMERLSPELDRAIETAFTNFGKENNANT